MQKARLFVEASAKNATCAQRVSRPEKKVLVVVHFFPLPLHSKGDSMPFTVRSTMNIVLEESPGQISPMLLPWARLIEDAGPTARIGGGTIPVSSSDFQVSLPGITTVTTLWFFPEVDMGVKVGAGNATPIVVSGGGCYGFSHGSLAASGAIRVDYNGADPGPFTVVWCGS